MHLILTGATGLVGSAVLDAMLNTKGITKISILSRRPVKMAEDAKDPRVSVIIHKDFEQYDSAVLDQLKGANGCVWALGISQTQVGKEDYIKITKTYALEAAKAFQTIPPEKEPFNFVYVSGTGATTEPGRFSAIFARTKGETELALAEMRKSNNLFHASSIRPAFIDPRAHKAIHAYIPPKPLAYRAMMPVMGVVTIGLPDYWSPTQPLGKFMTEMAMGRKLEGENIQKVGDLPILENTAFQRLAGIKR